MIVQPDFPEHWKTRLLVEITGDESTPLAVIRLWAYCQNRRCCNFPNMTATQLASICKWGTRKPACHFALSKAGFLEKLPGGGFAAHQWDEHNAQLIQKWHAGQKGGRPPANANTNGQGQVEKPTGYRSAIDREPGRNPIDQTRPEEIEKNRPDQTEQPPLLSRIAGDHDGNRTFNGGTDFSKILSSDGMDGLTKEVAGNLRVLPFKEPTLQEIRTHLLFQFSGADKYAEAFFKTMKKQRWKDRDGRPVKDWRPLAKEYASSAERKNRGVSIS
jgi:hypothetical protein